MTNTPAAKALEELKKLPKTDSMMDDDLYAGQWANRHLEVIESALQSTINQPDGGELAEALDKINNDGFEKIDPELWPSIKALITHTKKTGAVEEVSEEEFSKLYLAEAEKHRGPLYSCDIIRMLKENGLKIIKGDL